MNPLLRWLRFNLVGAMGMAVQLTALALLNRCARGHYLVASAAALELTLLHNFLWHWHYTWRDRRGTSTPLRAFLRFQLSNGMVSLLTNLVVMRLLVGHGHLPVLAATLISIVGSAVLNYLFGNTFVFPLEGKKAQGFPQNPVKPPNLGKTLQTQLSKRNKKLPHPDMFTPRHFL